MRKHGTRAKILALALGGLLSTGCTVYTSPPPPPPPAPGPVVEGPGVVVITEEPPYDQRVYVYDPGFPPGTYYYPATDCYYYNGYVYPHEVFVDRYVAVNVREHRFVDREANARAGRVFEDRARADYARRGGRPAPGRPEEHRDRP
jgi:hypothetical protein